MATETLFLRVKLRAWTRGLLWIGKRSPKLLWLIVWPLGVDRFASLVARYGVRVTAA